MKSFREVTRQGRPRRFREIAQVALTAYGLDDTRLSFVQYTANTVYRVDAHLFCGLAAAGGVQPFSLRLGLAAGRKHV